MKARIPLSNKISKRIREDSKQAVRQEFVENVDKILRLFAMIACETMINEYGFGKKRLPGFVKSLKASIVEFTDIFEDSTEFKIQQDFKEIGFHFDKVWEARDNS